MVRATGPEGGWSHDDVRADDPTAGRHRAGGAAARRLRWLRELGLLVGLYAGYSAARLLGDADLAGATANAHDLLALERSLHLDIEGPANAAVQAWPLLAIVASYWYSLLHYVVTPAVLVWVYRRRHGDYPRVRNALVIASAIGLVGFTLLPMAPPRMLPGLRRHPRHDRRQRLVGRRRQRPQGAGRADQPARRDAVAARRLGGLGRLGRGRPEHPPLGADPGDRLPRRHHPRRGRDGEPLPARRRRRRPRRGGRHPAGPLVVPPAGPGAPPPAGRPAARRCPRRVRLSPAPAGRRTRSPAARSTAAADPAGPAASPARRAVDGGSEPGSSSPATPDAGTGRVRSGWPGRL